MNMVQASFQASVDSCVHRLQAADLDELRVMFRYFDTDGDGAVAADQACCMFALLGLDVNVTHVRELGEVSLNEFIQIVDRHVHILPPVASQAPATNTMVLRVVPDLSSRATEKQLQRDNLLDEEWKLLDPCRRGRVSKQELMRFLANCQANLSHDAMDRFLESYGHITEHDVYFTRDHFLAFSRKCMRKKIKCTCHNNQNASDPRPDPRVSQAPFDYKDATEMT